MSGHRSLTRLEGVVSSAKRGTVNYLRWGTRTVWKDRRKGAHVLACYPCIVLIRQTLSFCDQCVPVGRMRVLCYRELELCGEASEEGGGGRGVILQLKTIVVLRGDVKRYASIVS